MNGYVFDGENVTFTEVTQSNLNLLQVNQAQILTITFLSTVSFLPNSAFEYYSSLTLANLSLSPLEILSSRCFYMCEKLLTVFLPKNLITIEPFAFYSCSKLRNIAFPDTLQMIKGPLTFTSCQMTSLTFPDSLITIGSSAFNSCNKVETILFSKSVQNVFGAFVVCKSIKTIVVSPENPYFEVDGKSGIMFTKGREKAVLAPRNVTSRDVLPNCTTEICDNAFDSSQLTEIDLSHVFIVGNYAFQKSQLFTINLSNAHKIGSYGFAYTIIFSLFLPDLLGEINNSAFYSCESLYVVNSSNQCILTKMSSSCFYLCSSLTTIALPHLMTVIQSNCFCGCSQLTNVYLPPFVKELGHMAFGSCRSLGSICLPKSLSSMDERVFASCGKMNITYLGSLVFSNSDVFYATIVEHVFALYSYPSQTFCGASHIIGGSVIITRVEKGILSGPCKIELCTLPKKCEIGEKGLMLTHLLLLVKFIRT